MFGTAILLPIVWTAIILYALYWVIRLAVRHALQDQATPKPPSASADE